MKTALRIIAIAVASWLAACSSAPVQETVPGQPLFTSEQVVPEDVVRVSDVYDPWEPVNRRIYTFNYHFDQWVFLPVVNGYRAVVPQFARTGISNFFNNWRDLRTFFNSVLQLNPDKSFQSAGRVLINTTVGLLGFVDVAGYLDVPRPQEDFGQTLGYYGVGKGPFLVLPFLGPSNLRDGLGYLPDYLTTQRIREEVFSDDLQSWIFIPESIETRDAVNFRYYETGTPFEYENIRWLWSVKRDLDVEN